MFKEILNKINQARTVAQVLAVEWDNVEGLSDYEKEQLINLAHYREVVLGGPACYTTSDLQSGQPGQRVRRAIRFKLLAKLYQENVDLNDLYDDFD